MKRGARLAALAARERWRGVGVAQYATVAALKIMAAVWFHLTATVRPAREIWQEQRLQAAAKAK
jgi:hypothetical protein